MMIICPNCKTEQEAMKFCGNCGTRLPDPKKKCPQCNTEWPNEQKFCGECGFNFFADNKSSQKSAITLGNDNMIAGDFIGKKEDYHIAGSATIVKNEDETKKTSECAICGSIVSIIDGYTCKSCGKFVCEECFDKQSKVCADCSFSKQIKLLKEENNFLSEEHRLYLEDAYNNFMNRVSTTDNFETVKILLERNPNNEKVINAYLQMAEFVAPFEAYNFIEQFNEKVQQGETDLLCVQLSLLRLYVKVKELTEFEKGIRKIKIKWPDYKNILAYEAVYQILMAEELNDTLRQEKLEIANTIIQSLNYSEKDKFEKSYIFYVKCLYDNAVNDKYCEWSEISENNDLYPRIILNSLGKVTISQNDVCDFTNISEAIEKSPSGSHLCICSGEYFENINIDKEVTLEGVDEDVFIISNTEKPCLSINSNGTVILNNLKLKNPSGDFAVSVENSSFGIFNSSITDSYVGLCLKNSLNIGISECYFDNNKAIAIMLENSNIEIENTEIKNSGGPQITIRLGSTASIKDSKILSGEKKGIIVDNSEAKIINCEFTNNAKCNIDSRNNAKVFLNSCQTGDDKAVCFYRYGGSIESSNCKDFIIQDSNEEIEFTKNISARSYKNSEDAKFEYEKGVELLQTDGEIDYAEAFECFKKATELDENLADAYYILGRFYEDGIGCNQNHEQAFKCYEKALILNPEDSDFLLSLGRCYFYGKGNQENNEKAFELFQKSVEIDNEKIEALYYLGLCYYYGYGCSGDDGKAFKLFKSIVDIDSEHENALYLLGECYYGGYGCTEDGKESRDILKKVLEINPDNEKALYLLGCIYYFGKDIYEDYHYAYNYLKKAAEKDHANAQYMLGNMIYQGLGCNKNINEAVDWYKKSINGGSVAATFEYGRILYEEEISFGGSAYSKKEGRGLIQDAANQGYEEAKEYLKNQNRNNLPATRNQKKKSDSGDNLVAGATIGAGAALLGAAAWGVGKWLFGDDKKK